jgi:diguanylate cyclase (GGDEF)-like protein/PAS domain S-box-containing protein
VEAMTKVAATAENAGTFLFGRSYKMLRKIVDRAAIGMAVTGMDGVVVYTNSAFEREFAPDRSTSASILHGFFDPRDLDVISALSNVFEGRNEGYDGEHLCRGHGGKMIWALIAVSVLKSDTTGEPIYVIVQVGSIDRRKQVESALAESESRWHFALEAARQGVWDHNARTGRMFYSPMWRTMRGIPHDEAVDDDQEAWLERVHPDDRDRLRPNVSRQNKGEQGYDILEYRERHRDGHYIWILSRGKPVEWDEDGKVLRTVGTDTDITHLKKIEARLAHAASHDSLTQLVNRPAFQTSVETALAGLASSYLVFLDLDHFKPINDALGHAAGDNVLVEVGRVLRHYILPTDAAARIGGDEFAVLLNNTDKTKVYEIAKTVSDAIRSITVGQVPAGDLPTFGVSVGIVGLSSEMDFGTALARADAACYAAKRAGRGRIVMLD